MRLLLSVPEEEGGFVDAAPVMQVREIFRRFWPYARPYRRWIPLIVLFSALGSAIGVATIWMYKILVDEVLVPRDFGLLGWVVLAYLGLTLAEGIVSFCDEYLSEWVAGRFIVSLRTDLFRHLQGLSLSFFDRQSLGDMLARLSDDVEEIEELMVSELAAALTYLFQFVFFVGALFYLEWRLALVSLFAIPLFLFLARDFSRKIRRATREERRRIGSVNAVAEESLSNVALVQAYNRQENEVSRFHRENEGSFVAEMAATRLSALFSPLVNLIELAGVVRRYRRGNLGAFPGPPHDRWPARLPGLPQAAVHAGSRPEQLGQHALRGHGRGREGHRVFRPEAFGDGTGRRANVEPPPGPRGVRRGALQVPGQRSARRSRT